MHHKIKHSPDPSPAGSSYKPKMADEAAQIEAYKAAANVSITDMTAFAINEASSRVSSADTSAELLFPA